VPRQAALRAGRLEPGEAVHRDNLDPVPPLLRPVGQSLLEHLIRAALDHVQQPCRSRSVPDRGEVDDHGDVLLPAAGVPPDVLIHTDDPHPVEPARVLDQQTPAFVQNRAVGRVPGDAKACSDSKADVSLASRKKLNPVIPHLTLGSDRTQIPIPLVRAGQRFPPGWAGSRRKC
jgi:hypothetical protein